MKEEKNQYGVAIDINAEHAKQVQDFIRRTRKVQA